MAVYERNPNTGVETTVAGIQDLSVYESRISDIEDVIPSDATSSNQLITESDLGTAAAKDFTDTVRPNSHDLVESNAVYSAINNALSSIYTPRGALSCAELTSALLIEANVGNVYEMSDSGTTSALFIQGAGTTISVGDNVGIIKAGQNTYMFNYMGNAFDLTDYQKIDLSQAVEGATTVEGALGALSTNKATQAEVNDIVNVLGAKNLLPFNLSHIKKVNGGGTWNGNVYTYRDITYTVNADGTITVNGTANGDSIFRVLDNASLDFALSSGKTYYYTGSPATGSSASTYYSYYSELVGGTWTYFMSYGTSDTSITPNASATQIVVDIFVKSGKTINNQIFKPMIRLASDPDNTYVPYAPTNAKLNEEKMSYADNGVLGAKNLFDGSIVTTTTKGVTFTQNADGTISVTGSNTQGSSLGIFANRIQKLKAGSYVLSGCPSPTSGGLHIQLSDNDAGVLIAEIYDGNEVSFSLNADTNCKIMYWGSGNLSITGTLVIKPMIRIASDPDDTYVPYAKTNKELTDVIPSDASASNKLVTESVIRFYEYTSSNVPTKASFLTLLASSNAHMDFKFINVVTNYMPNSSSYWYVQKFGGTDALHIRLLATDWVSGDLYTGDANSSNNTITWWRLAGTQV